MCVCFFVVSSFLFLFFSFFFFWVSRQWYNLHLVSNWENVSWSQKTCDFLLMFYFYFSLCFSCFLFLRKMFKTKKDIVKKHVFKGSHIRAAKVFLLRCAVAKSKIVCGWHFGSQSLVWSVVVRFISISVLTHVVFSQWSFLPQAVNPMMAGMNPFLASMFGPAFALLVPTALTLFWWIDEARRYTSPPTTWAPDVPFFVSCCQTFGTVWPLLSKQNQFW